MRHLFLSDVIKSRYQGAPAGTYNSFLHCFRITIAQDGVGALFRGAGPAILRAFPANAATFVRIQSVQLVSPHARLTLAISFMSAARRGSQPQADESTFLIRRQGRHSYLRPSIDCASHARVSPVYSFRKKNRLKCTCISLAFVGLLNTEAKVKNWGR